MRAQADARHVQVRAELPGRPAAGARRPGEAPARAVQPDPERDPPHAGGRLGRRARGAGRRRASRSRSPTPATGIAADDRDRVFEPFFRGGAQAARPSNGAGLGLAISRAIVEAHGGRIWLEDAPAGTSVRFSIAVHNLRSGYAARAMAHQQLWLLRHGEAVPHESKPDFDRELTARGERQSVAAGGRSPGWASSSQPATRARSCAPCGTAGLACEPLNVTPEEREAVGKGFDVDAVRELLAEHGDGRAHPRRRAQPVVRAGRARPHGRARRLQEGRRRRRAGRAPGAASCSRCCARASSRRSRARASASAASTSASATSARLASEAASTNSPGLCALPPRGPSPSTVSGIDAREMAGVARAAARARRRPGRPSAAPARSSSARRRAPPASMPGHSRASSGSSATPPTSARDRVEHREDRRVGVRAQVADELAAARARR